MFAREAKKTTLTAVKPVPQKITERKMRPCSKNNEEQRPELDATEKENMRVEVKRAHINQFAAERTKQHLGTNDDKREIQMKIHEDLKTQLMVNNGIKRNETIIEKVHEEKLARDAESRKISYENYLADKKSKFAADQMLNKKMAAEKAFREKQNKKIDAYAGDGTEFFEKFGTSAL
ncbi:MAG: hypothetical protein EZS28_008433 [Streblomastix strix]|uniref:Uncharacterized protein n=1 Tax=Streblomastix strix TaxID=222440 RepID=A0A5J4WN74_9EUKA|nr:MAG: hypothetical protein EZS28_008433 [Streblomastix strix]